MTLERPIGAEPAAQPASHAASAPDPAQAMRLQILATEHWSLLASRALAWNEVFSRAGMFLATLSGAIVALALVADASDFGADFRHFALVILPVVLFIGVGTLLRLSSAQYHDALCVLGMNRIRAKYVELAPDLEPLFVMGTRDDEHGIVKTMAIDFRQSPIAHILGATPLMVATLDSIVLGAIAALLAFEAGASDTVALTVAAAVFIAGSALHAWYAKRTIATIRSSLVPLFPTPDS